MSHFVSSEWYETLYYQMSLVHFLKKKQTPVGQIRSKPVLGKYRWKTPWSQLLTINWNSTHFKCLLKSLWKKIMVFNHIIMFFFLFKKKKSIQPVSLPMFPFYIPWKGQLTEVLLVFSGMQNWEIDQKWVKTFLNLILTKQANNVFYETSQKLTAAK